MYFNQDEHERAETPQVQADVAALDASAFEGFGELTADDIAPPAAAQSAEPVRTAFSWVGFFGSVAAVAWVGGVLGIAATQVSASALASGPLFWLGLTVLTFAPALLFWLTASAASEALKTRRLAVELTRLARCSRAPFEMSSAEARALSRSASDEIAALNSAMAGALDRLRELESAVQHSTAGISDAFSISQQDAETLSATLARERAALATLSGELRGQTEHIADSIGRQIRLMREASKLVKSEMSAAEDALDAHLAAFAAAASSMGEHATSMKNFASDAVATTGRLDGAMGRMLQSLSETTRLAEAARLSSESAVEAARETAGAVRQTALSAIDEAKRATDAVRAESAAMQVVANDTLTTLQNAAATARTNAQKSLAAVHEHAPAQAALAEAAAAPKIATPPRSTDIYAAAAAARAAYRERAANDQLPEPANESKASPVRAKESDAELKLRALDLVANCGVDLDRTLNTHDLNQIASSSRNGAAARRRAVLSAAPGAVGRITRRLRGSEDAHAIATEFRARPDLAKSPRKGEGSDLVRAYLLIDAALAS
ncbi:MAG: hypothetical protein K2P58_08500 [Hyphomonadaceae bacterium]|nr:hypothetical protein [Hyphomonadaceae bacterium]